jgi:high-affinity nickel-transport protein
MSTSPFAVLGLGFVLGLRHALDVDHLAAVSTIVSQRRGLCRSSLIGAAWGLGHTVSLVAVAVGVIGLHAQISPAIGRLFELGVAGMLVVLGVDLLRSVAGRRRHAHPGHVHSPSGRRPFLVGLVHGLAGSAALMLAVVASIPSPTLALAYVGVFGIGSVGGMAAMSALLAVPTFLAGEFFADADRVLRLGAAAASVAIGLHLAWQIGAEAGVLA